MFCPCCSGKKYPDCCQPYLTGQTFPDTAEALMRSRYTAYTQANIDYIVATMRGPAAENYDAQDAKQWAEQCEWQGLDVIASDTDGSDPNCAFVEFNAHYCVQQKRQTLHERSEFHRVDNRWFYVTGASESLRAPKVGRNDPCPCGSGKKYKKCCADKS